MLQTEQAAAPEQARQTAATVAMAAAETTAELTIVVPTFNERDNVPELIERLSTLLQGVRWEAVFVDDDSADGTVDALRQAARRDPRVRLLHRINRRGLSSAVVEGIQSSAAPFVAVMDADLQHDETIQPEMLARLRGGACDVVVGSRYSEGGGFGEWSKERIGISQFATKLARLVIKSDLTDPMSGFFMLRRDAFDGAVRHLSTQGYKILLDILASTKAPLRVAEVAYTFRTRVHGESKLDSAVTWEYLMLLVDKMVGHIVPVRFVMFMAVGGAGVVVHMAVLAALFRGFGETMVLSQSIATVTAMSFNYFANNLLTYRDKRLKGFWGNLRGLLSFYAVCSLGAVANVGIANFLFTDQNYSWWLSGVAGILVGAVWNYAASSLFTWRK